METVKLYYSDPFLKSFEAEVLSCEAGKGGWQVALDRTAFYPEGGGQPTDHGTLGDAKVSEVHEKAGVILHTVDVPLSVGSTVRGELDWERRFDHMQQHSGEHILSGILCGTHHCDNVGFHLGADTVVIDLNTDLTWEQVMEAELAANRIIWADQPVDASFPSPEALEALDYRSKKELTGQVRIVTFPDADCCACCGTHVLRAGQVGLIKVLSCQKFRQGVRIEFLCGGRALKYLSAVYGEAKASAQQLSVKSTDLYAAVERLVDELAASASRTAELEKEVFSALASDFAGQGDVLLFRPTMRSDSLSRLADDLARSAGGLAAVFAGPDGDRFSYTLVKADGGDVSALVKEMNAALNGRGGGRKGFAQGIVRADQAAIEAYFRK